MRDDGVRMREWFTPAMYQATQEYNFGDQSGFKSFKVQTFHADNPHYWDVDEWDWKPAGREYVINQLGKMSGPRKARYLEGRPAAAEGVVFIEFDPEKHVYPPCRLEYNTHPAMLRVALGIGELSSEIPRVKKLTG